MLSGGDDRQAAVVVVKIAMVFFLFAPLPSSLDFSRCVWENRLSVLKVMLLAPVLYPVARSYMAGHDH